MTAPPTPVTTVTTTIEVVVRYTPQSGVWEGVVILGMVLAFVGYLTFLVWHRRPR